MGDAVAGRHQVDLTGANDLAVAQAVVVHHLSFQHPGEGLQRGVRVRAHAQAAARCKADRARVVEKAPGADGAALGLRQHAGDGRVGADDGGARGQALGRLFAHGRPPLFKPRWPPK